MQTAVIYCRVSSDEQVGNTSLASQEAECRAWCARSSLTVSGVFRDAGETAKTADRPQFLDLQAWCARHRPAVCVVWKFDRWARNSTDHAVYAAALAKCGTRLQSATEPTSDDPAGRLLQTMLAGIAQFDNEVRAERTRHGMRAVARRGGWLAKAPFGYRIARDGSLPILLIDQATAPLVRELFDGLASRRRTVLQAEAFAGEHGISAKTLRMMLRQPVYAGFIRSALTEWQEIPAAFPGIVQRSAWDAVQAIIASRRHVYGVRAALRPEWPLRGILRCAECGDRVTACWVHGRGGRYQYYQCAGGHARGRVEAVHESLQSLLSAAGAECRPKLAAIRAAVFEAARDRLGSQDRVEAEAAAVTAGLRARHRRLVDALEHGAITATDFRDRLAVIEHGLAEARANAARASSWAADVEAVVNKAVGLIHDPAATWSNLDAAAQQRYLLAIFGDVLTLDRAGTVQTSASAGVLKQLREQQPAEFGMVPPRVIRSNLLAALRELAALAA